jgi:hypothetical protein
VRAQQKYLRPDQFGTTSLGNNQMCEKRTDGRKFASIKPVLCVSL